MFKKLLLVLPLLVLLLVTAQAQQTMKIASYNIRYDNKGDTVNAWTNRLPVMSNLIKFHDFDIFGTQEGMYHQLQGLERDLQDFSFVGKGRDDGKQAGEFSAIFYKKDKYKLQKNGTFWLSTDTQKPNKGWDAALPRVCTWAQFTDNATGLNFYVFNVHFDHRGEQARTESSKLVLNQIKKIAGNAPVILTGDFNFNQQHDNFKILSQSGFMKDAYETADVVYAPNGTFNAFNINHKSDSRIDHIFLTSGFDVTRYGILTDSYGGKFPSDHFPILIEVTHAGKK